MLGAQDGRPAVRQLFEQVGDRGGPGRIELGRRLVEDEDGRPHRHDARDRDPLLLAAGQGEWLAIGEVGDAQPGQGVVDPRVHLGPRRRPRFSSPNASSSRTVCFEADSWLAGVANTIPTRPSSASGGGPGGGDPDDLDPTVEPGPDDARDEAGGGQRQGRLAGTGPAGHADPLAGGNVERDAGSRLGAFLPG